jgi:cell division protein FtsQ
VTDSLRHALGWLLLALFVLAAGWLAQGLMRPITLPVKSVQVMGEFRFLDRARLQAEVEAIIAEGVLVSSTRQLREAMVALPWVKDATVRKQWPSQLIIQISEHTPVALWGEDSVVVADAMLIHPGRQHRPQQMVRFSGSEQAVEEMLAFYRAIQATGAPWLADLEELALSRYGSWSMNLRTDLRVNLGRRDLSRRLQRLARVWVRLPHANGMRTIDLRYQHGLAVTLAGPSPESADAQLEG